MPGGGVRIGRAAGRDVPGLEAQAGRERDDVVREAAGALELLHRRPAGQRLDIDRDVRHGWPGRQVVDRGQHRGEVATGHRANVDVELRLVAHDVRPRPGLEDADVRGHVRPAAVERVDALDEPGAGEDRAATLLRLDARVRGTAVDRQLDVGHALARRDEVAVRARALEHEARVRGRRELLDVRRRRRRPDLLVRVRDEGQPFEWEPGRRARAVHIRRPQRRDRPQAGEQARLHVAGAGAVGDAALDAERPLGDRALGEDRVHVADQQDPRAGAGRPLERPDHRVAVPALRVGAALDRYAPRNASSASTRSAIWLTPAGV